MTRIKVFAKVTVGLFLGIALAVAGGCDRTPAPTEADKNHAINQSQARVAAYGKSSGPTAARGSIKGQSSARRTVGR